LSCKEFFENLPKQENFIRAFGSHIGCKLAKFLSNYAEAAEEDGVMVALDQEKAYDRITAIGSTYIRCRLKKFCFVMFWKNSRYLNGFCTDSHET
jgi:hypothetical protein